jgi:hypothetical protein
MTRTGFWLAVAATLLLALPASSFAAASPRAKRAAEHALQKVKDLKRGIGVRSGRELTPALIDLARRRGALDAAGRKQADAILARPTDPGEGFPGHSYTTTEAAPFCDAHFCVHYVTTTSDAPSLTDATGVNGIPDYVEKVLSVFADDVFPCENGSAALGCPEGGTGLGWPLPPSDGDGKTDIYIEQLGSSGGVLGYAAPEQSTHSASGYLVMDNDYADYGYGDPTVPLEVTAAHEYNHILQMGMDSWEDGWMFESTATYIEEKVYPSLNDYFQYLPDWVSNTGQPLTDADTSNNLKVYGSAVWNLWLDHAYGGDDVIQSAWSQSTAIGSFAPDAYGKSIQDHGGAGFADEFENFAAAVAEWRAPNSGFPDLYPDVPSRPDLPVDSGTASVTLDHTTFAFADIQPPAPGLPIGVTANVPPGLKGAIALVGRTGSSDTAGTVTTKITSTKNGGRLLVVLPDASSFGRITAVFINADPSNTGFNSSTGDWNFTRDSQKFTAISASTRVPPSATTGSATGIATTAAMLNGSVNPNGTPATYWFEYGTTTTYGSSVPAPPADAGSGTSDVPVSVPVTGLAPGSTYHYRLVAQGPGGTQTGADQTFTTPSPPVVTTGPATGVGAESATLNATVDPRGLATTYVFEYGRTTTYGKKVPLTPAAAGSASQPLAVTSQITGLRPGTAFHYRVVATNAAGSATGADATVKTSPLRVVVTVSKTKLRNALKRGLSVRPRCNTNCSLALQLRLPAKLAKKLGVKRVVATGRTSTGPGGRMVRLRFAKKVARRLARQRSLAMTLVLTAKTRTGGKRVATKAVRLR